MDIVIGGIACLALAMGMAWFLMRKRPPETGGALGQESEAPVHAPTGAPDQRPGEAVTDEAEHLAEGIRAFMKGDYARAFTLLQEPAADDNLKAQLLMAKMYYAGNGVAADHEKYVYWLEKAADNGDRPAKTKLKKIRKKANEHGAA